MSETGQKYETDLETLERECEFEYSRSSGPGGQNVNKTESRVRLRHLPSGIEVVIDKTPSQYRNKQIAFEILQKKLVELNNPPQERKSTRVPYAEKVKRRKEKRRRGETKRLRKEVSDDLF